jgi:hypothetical protein
MNAVSSSLPLPLFPRPIFMYRILTLILFQVCDDQIRNGGTLASHGNKFCDMSCPGNQGGSQSCGGGSLLDIYEYGFGNGTA